MDIPYFFAAAAGGFVLMAAVGVQALVAIFSSLPLARRRKKENPDFDFSRAFRRIIKVAVIIAVLVVLVTALVIHFAPIAPTIGYLFGMILAFVMCIKRMTPNNEQNRKNFEDAYADCYPPGAVPPEEPTQE